MDKNMEFSPEAQGELKKLLSATEEIVELSLKAFLEGDLEAAHQVEPLEQVIDRLKEQMRSHHIIRLQQRDCTIEVGFIWSDILTNLERTADHCSNIAGCVIDTANNNMNIHQSLRDVRTDNADFDSMYKHYKEKYAL